MLPDLGEIRVRRKKLGLTQGALARISGVSQSLIAKTEAGQIVPAYDKAKRILDQLEGLAHQHELKAKDLMSRKVVSVEEKDSLKKAIQLMEEAFISQLPVLRGGQSVGTVSEKGVVFRLGNQPNPRTLSEMHVSEVMEESLPVIGEDLPFGLLSELLGHYPALLVAKKGKITGVLSKSDLLQAMLKSKR